MISVTFLPIYSSKCFVYIMHISLLQIIFLSVLLGLDSHWYRFTYGMQVLFANLLSTTHAFVGVWLDEYQRTNTIKTMFKKE